MDYKKKWQTELLRHLRKHDTDEVSTRDSRILGYISELEEAGRIEIVSRESGVIVVRLKREQPPAASAEGLKEKVMDVEVTVNSVDAQHIYVRLDDDLKHYVVQIADVEFHGLPRWALEDLRNRIVETLEWKPPPPPLKRGSRP